MTDPDAGRIVGKFVIERELGRGGMAIVYLARQTDLDRRVALKELAAFHRADAAFAARFLRESRIAGSLQHSNIVMVHEYFEHDDVPYIAMEYVERGSLRPHVSSLSLAQIAGVLEGVLAGLAQAESQGIIHRDLKPENLMVTRDGTIKIADFGIAKALHQVAATTGFATETGTTVGTPAYMAPEQAMARGIGTWTDRYSLGVIAYELLTGKVPFHDTETPVAVLLRHVNDPPPPPQSLRPDLDPELCAWLERMLRKAPEERYGSALEAWEALDEIVLRLLGPRWRREARLVVPAPAGDEPTPLTPASFESVTADTPADPAAAVTGEDGFVTVDPRSRLPVAPPPPPESPPDPAPDPVAPPPAPEPVPAEHAEVVDSPPAAVVPTPPPEPVAAPTTPPEPAAAPPEPAALPPEPSDDATTIVPTPSVPPPPAPTLQPTGAPPRTPPTDGRRGRNLVAVGLVAVAVAGIGGALALTLTSGDGGGGPAGTTASAADAEALTVSTLVASDPPASVTEQPATEPDTVASGASTEVGARDQVTLAAIGDDVYVADPHGLVLRLDGGSLEAQARLENPAHPLSLAAGDGVLYATDDDGVSVLDPETLEPRAGYEIGGAPLVATAPSGLSPHAVGLQGDGGGRLCQIRAEGLEPCIDLPFVPTGLGVDGSGTAWVADAASGSVQPFRGRPEIRAGEPLFVGGGAAGVVPVRDGVMAVAVTDGVAIVDVPSRSLRTVVELPATPGRIAIDRTGIIVAPLPTENMVALIDPTVEQPEAVLHEIGPVPFAAVDTPDGVVVLNAGDRSITRLDATDPDDRETTPIGELAAQDDLPAIVAREVSATSDGAVTTVAISLSGRPRVRILDGNVVDASMAFELWSGGIGADFAEGSFAGGTLTVRELPGRLLVTLETTSPFVSAPISLGAGGREVRIALTEAPASPEEAPDVEPQTTCCEEPFTEPTDTTVTTDGTDTGETPTVTDPPTGSEPSLTVEIEPLPTTG